MGEKHKIDKHGVLKDGVSHYPANAQDLQSYVDARQGLSQLRTPVLLHANNPNERLYVAAFDGTGNDVASDPEHATSVARFHEEISRNRGNNPRVISGYVEGPGTQKNFFVRTWDGARGHTYDERLERMYELFINQAKTWRDENPNVQIRLANLGFSRGAEQAAGFARLVHERGIQDPSGAAYTRDRNGDVIGVTYTRPPLVAPGKTAQVAALFDPVGTGEPVNDHDRRLPPSIISGFQLTAEDERRDLFKSSPIMPLGYSDDGRFYNAMVGGCHSDLAASYHRNGLGIRSANLMAVYLNSLSDQPFLPIGAEPDDPRLNVVHRSEEGMLLYRVSPKVDRRLPEGVNERLVPKEQLKHVTDGYHAEPREDALAMQFEFRSVPIGPIPASPTQAANEMLHRKPANDPTAIVDRLLTAAASGDNATFRDATRTAADHDAARALREHAVTTVDQQQAARQQQMAQQPEAPQHDAPVRRPTVPMH